MRQIEDRRVEAGLLGRRRARLDRQVQEAEAARELLQRKLQLLSGSRQKENKSVDQRSGQKQAPCRPRQVLGVVGQSQSRRLELLCRRMKSIAELFDSKMLIVEERMRLRAARNRLLQGEVKRRSDFSFNSPSPQVCLALQALRSSAPEAEPPQTASGHASTKLINEPECFRPFFGRQ